jgi:hypothetical protein
MTYARVDADGNALREADGSLEMRPAQPMEYANGVRHNIKYHLTLGHLLCCWDGHAQGMLG